MPRPGKVNNPTGKGGFQDHPELMSGGRWSKDTSISYWLNLFLRMSVADFRDWENKVKEKDRTAAQSIAYARVFAARASLKETEYVTNRTEGYPVQPIDQLDTLEDLNNLSERQLRARIKDIDQQLKKTTRRKGKTTAKANVEKGK